MFILVCQEQIPDTVAKKCMQFIVWNIGEFWNFAKFTFFYIFFHNYDLSSDMTL